MTIFSQCYQLDLSRLISCISISLLSSILIACGGDTSTGNGNSHSIIDTIDHSTIPTRYDDELIIQGDTDSVLGKMTSLVAYHPSEIVADYQWQQISGTPVTLSSYRQGVVTFRPNEVGVYEFVVTITTDIGTQYTNQIVVNVSPQSFEQPIELLRDRAVIGNRSFIMRLSNGKDSELTLDTSNMTIEVQDNSKYKLVANLDKATGTLHLRSAQSNTSQLSKVVLKDNGLVIDEAYVLIEGSSDSTSPYFCNGSGVYCATSESLGRTFIYNSHSQYADVLQSCTFSNQLKRNKLCTIDTLPPLGYITTDVSLDDIKDRLIVGEEWMGDRFLDFMVQMDGHGDLKTLFGSATSIVISDDIQVPFYWALTGTIYLSPYDLYSNETEYLSVAKPYDYHENLTNSTSTSFMWQYLQNNRDIAVGIDYRRNQQDIHHNFAALLYHELSHANDFYPYHQLSNFEANKTILENLSNISDMTSSQLTMTYPLSSEDLKSLAMYSFKKHPVSSSIMDGDSSYFANEFLNDGANDLYNYTNEKEDMAMLFEETMMKYRFDIDRNVIIYDQRTDEVIKTRKNRIFDESVSARAKLVASNILPELSSGFENFF